MGVAVDPQHALRLVDRGPPADDAVKAREVSGFVCGSWVWAPVRKGGHPTKRNANLNQKYNYNKIN